MLKSYFVFTTLLMEQGYRKLSEAVLVHCTDVCVILESLWGETKLEFGNVRCRKWFLKFSLILFENAIPTLHHLIHRPIFFRIEVAEKPFHYFSTWMPNHTIFFLRAAFKFGRGVHFALRRKMRKPPISRVPAILNGLTNRPSWKTDNIYADIFNERSTLPWMTSIEVNSNFE